MCEDSDEETSELDIQSRTWKKLESRMKLEGFREGVAKGKYLSLQEGFNWGYSDGFRVGECIGMYKGITTCESKIDMSGTKKSNFYKDALDSVSSEACILCLQEKKSNPSFTETISLENVEDLISAQRHHNNEIIKTLGKTDKEFLEKDQ